MNSPIARSIPQRLVRKLKVSFTAILFILSLSTPATAQLVFETREVTLNSEFESAGQGSLENWNYYEGLNPTLQQHDFEPATVLDRSVGDHLIRLRGTGGFGQIAAVPADCSNLQFHVLAYRQAIDGIGDGFGASAQLTLYDGSWNALDVVPIRIDGRSATNASGLNAYTWGVGTPPGTAFALLAVFSFDANTEVFVDNFGLADATNRARAPESRNMVSNFNPRLRTLGLSGGSFLLGAEFWYSHLDADKFDQGLDPWGSQWQDEFAYQFLALQGGESYIVDVERAFTPFPNNAIDPQVGIDVYDAQWNNVGKQVLPLGGPLIERDFAGTIRFDVPSNVAHSSLYIYVPQGTTSYAPTFRVFELGQTSSEMDCIVSSAFPNNSSQFTLRFTDPDGIDLSSFSVDDFYVTSRSDANKTYKVELLRAFGIGAELPPVLSDNDRVLSVGLLVVADPPPSRTSPASNADYRTLVIKPNSVFDKRGNPLTPSEFAEFGTAP